MHELQYSIFFLNYTRRFVRSVFRTIFSLSVNLLEDRQQHHWTVFFSFFLDKHIFPYQRLSFLMLLQSSLFLFVIYLSKPYLWISSV